MSNVYLATKLLKKALYHIHAAKSKTFSFKKGDRVAVYWKDKDNEKIVGSCLATVTMVRKNMVYIIWDENNEKYKLETNSPHWVGKAVPRKIKKLIPDSEIHFYITEWMNKPVNAVGEVGEKRKRTSRKNNAENLADLVELSDVEPKTEEQADKIEELIDESSEIDEMLSEPITEKQIETVDDQIKQIEQEIQEMIQEVNEKIKKKRVLQKKSNSEPEVSPEDGPKSMAGRMRLQRKLQRQRDRNKILREGVDEVEQLTSSVEKLEVGKTYQMIGSKRKLGKFYDDPFFKVLGANPKKNDTLYAIAYKNGKGKILGSALPYVVEK